MKTHTQKRLLDALEACKAIETFVANATFANYEKDLLLRSAVERQFEIIGEALHQAEIGEPGLTDQVPELHRIVGMRNRIIHGYDSVDDELLWQTVRHNIPPLTEHLKQILGAE
jgi:uncharacterized protein with HEPN domain